MNEFNTVQIDVLDHGYVSLDSDCFMGEDAAVLRAARICYGGEWTDDLEKNTALIKKLMNSKPSHNTVFEHSVFTFEVKQPVFTARQHLRHRVGSFNEKSLRYTSPTDYYVPYDVDGETQEASQYRAMMNSQLELYARLVKFGWKKERARMILGTAFYTTFIWTVNAWSLMNFLEKRLDSHAQWEIQQYAKAIARLFCDVMPITAQAFFEKIGYKLS
jgi:thymidylate synthase (FAD)